jgi:Flp pilus assembly protein TadD
VSQEVSAVSKRRTFSLVLSLVLALAVLAPRAALGNRALHNSASVASDTDPTASTPGASANDADTSNSTDVDDNDAQQSKPKGNAFARALAAPFRALARLFGGGGKSKSEQAKKQSTLPSQSTLSATTTTQTIAKEEAKLAAAASATKSTEQVVGAPQTSERAQASANVEPMMTPPASPIDVVAPSRAEASEMKADSSINVKLDSANSRRGGVEGVAQASDGARVIRPDAGEIAQGLQPKMWIPLIVGVPADPVSQGRALLQHGYIQEAIAELQIAATTVGPQLSEANNLLGLAYDRLGWHRQAAAAYERALTVTPKDFIALTNLGYSLYLADDYAGALKRLRQAAQLAPDEPVVFNNLGVVHARLGHYGDAYKNFARASNDYDAHLKLAGILEEQKRDRDAIKHYEAALRLQPGASAVLERLVALYERTGSRDKADTARRALTQPRNPQKTTTGGG